MHYRLRYVHTKGSGIAQNTDAGVIGIRFNPHVKGESTFGVDDI